MPGVLSGYLHKKRNGLVRRYVRGDVLDIGCGPATIAEFLTPSQKYVGIEIQEGYITYLRSRFPQHTFFRRDVERESLSLGSLRFDTVLMVALIEHLATPESVIVEVRKHIKPGGHLVISTPTCLGGAIHQFGATIGLFSREALADHKRTYGRSDLAALLFVCGMRIDLHKVFEFGANQLCVSTPVEWDRAASTQNPPMASTGAPAQPGR
jgi:2-polyprenyl-3-methyl-5-hydroxy-6-metoxy-1,4-benzoquinol methylase